MSPENTSEMSAGHFAALLQQEIEKLRQQEEPEQAPGEAVQQRAEGDRSIELVSIELLENYPSNRHPFRPASPERLEELKQSISENGILNPLIIWCRMDGKLVILAGHNRRTAAKLLGWQKVPCTVLYDLEESEAEAIMLADNLQQREELLPSERAKAYQMEMILRRRRAGRKAKSYYENNCGNDCHNLLRTREYLGADKKGRAVSMYIRLNYLIPELLEKVDTNALGIANAEQISFISRPGQQIIYTYFFVDKPRGKLDKKLIQELRRLDADPDKGIDQTAIDALFLAREESRSFRQVKIPMKPIRHFFPPDITEQEVLERLLEITEAYFNGSTK